MRRLARAGSEDADIRTFALGLIGGSLQKDYRREACILNRFVRDRIRYVRDTTHVEILQTPSVTMDIGAGDCDDKSILLAAFLQSIGHKCRFIAVSFMGDNYSHVWVQDAIGGGWLDLEPTEPLDCGQRVPGSRAVAYLTQDV